MKKLILLLVCLLLPSLVFCQTRFDTHGNIISMHPKQTGRTTDGRYKTYDVGIPTFLLLELASYDKIKPGLIEKELPYVEPETVHTGKNKPRIKCQIICYETEKHRIVGYNRMSR